MEIKKIKEILQKDSIKKRKIIQTSLNPNIAKVAIETLAGDDFVTDKYNSAVINLLLYYFHGMPKFESYFPNRKYFLHKGILLAGKIGTGKSTLMEIYSKYCKNFIKDNYFKVIDVRRVANHFVRNGTIDKFTYDLIEFHPDYEPNPVKNYCFDDLGTEPETVRYYGTEADPIRDLLMDRYILFKQYGIVTHATTNLDMKSLKERYGERVISRMYEMFNFIILDGKDRRMN